MSDTAEGESTFTDLGNKAREAGESSDRKSVLLAEVAGSCASANRCQVSSTSSTLNTRLARPMLKTH
jgi:hypothetical protein